MGAEQFDEDDPQEQREISSFFNGFFFSLCVGSFTAVTLLVYVQDDVSFAAGYGVALGGMVVSIPVFGAGYRFYQRRTRAFSPLVSILQVFVAALRNVSKPAPLSDMLYEIDDKEANQKNIKHTNQFRFLDKAAILDHSATSATSPWKRCTVTQVEEVKILFRMFPIFASTIVMNCLLAQLQTFSLAQARTMDRKVTNHFEIPPASLGFFPLFFMLIFLPIYDRLLVPLARRLTGHEHGITHLQRIGIGLLISTLCMVVGALVEKKRIRIASAHSLLDSSRATIPMKVYWMVLQYSAFGIADVFVFVGAMQFFYSESPEGMRSIATSLTWVGVSFGYFLSTMIVSLVKKTTKRGNHAGWLPDNVNRAKLSNFFWLLASLSSINLLLYVVSAYWYKSSTIVPQTVPDETSLGIAADP